MTTLLLLLSFLAASLTPAPAGPTTWFVRQDGGTRYSANVPTGQCNGLADAAYPGSGVNQPCAYNDVRYMWMDSTPGNFGWVMAGGDTLVIRGCTAQGDEQNPDAPHCRIGWNQNDHHGTWCQYVADENCAMPTPPAGTAGAHTRIIGGCAYGTYSCNPVSGYPYTNNNLTQLYAGFAPVAVLFLPGAQYVDFVGLEITSHNGQCTRHGYPMYPGGCSTGQPYSDFGDVGIFSTNTTGHILLQDVYIHGFSNGLFGPIGGPWTLTRVSIDMNTFAAWNMDDGAQCQGGGNCSTDNGAGAALIQSYVSMVGNGCLEEYPIVHTQFPAKACWDSSSGGFGDAWSGQAIANGKPSQMDTFTCDHCYLAYNTKDSAIGPHTKIASLSLTNSFFGFNMGQQGKWLIQSNANALVANNLIVGGCARMVETVPGAAHAFNMDSGLDGAYLSNFCRAAGNVFNFSSAANSTVIFANNTVIADSSTVFDFDCSADLDPHGCGSTPNQFVDNIFLGYTSSVVPGYNGQAPGLFYINVPEVVIQSSHNIEYGVRNGDTCGANGIICSSPLFVSQPAQGALPPEATLDAFNFHLTSGSPARGVGVTYSGMPTTDYAGNAYSSPRSLGALEFGSAPPTPPSGTRRAVFQGTRHQGGPIRP